MLRSRDERRITKPMQQAIDRVQRPELAEFVLQNPLHISATQRAYTVIRQGTGIEALFQSLRFLGRQWRLAATPRFGL